jgi:hypothetical protein
MYNYGKQNIIVNFINKNLKKKHNFPKKYKNKVLSPKELSFLSFEESVFVFQFLNNKMDKCVKQNIIVHFIIQKLKNKQTFLKKHAN